mmetsp:Transcript_11862/g.28035  ORF Transcript_11862/g.28035 Transcript_11862/m.28035 type:complete len:227 (+) Transcript_11862:574-1254(+)
MDSQLGLVHRVLWECSRLRLHGRRLDLHVPTRIWDLFPQSLLVHRHLGRFPVAPALYAERPLCLGSDIIFGALSGVLDDRHDDNPLRRWLLSSRWAVPWIPCTTRACGEHGLLHAYLGGQLGRGLPLSLQRSKVLSRVQEPSACPFRLSCAGRFLAGLHLVCNINAAWVRNLWAARGGCHSQQLRQQRHACEHSPLGHGLRQRFQHASHVQRSSRRRPGCTQPLRP